MEAALADISFQFILAKLFGNPVRVTNEGSTYTGFLWRDMLFVVTVTEELVEPPILPRTP